MKKLLSILLALVLLVDIAPMSAIADGDGYETVSGTIMFNAGHDDMETDHPCPFEYSDGYFTDSAYYYRQDLATVTMAMCLAAGNVADPARYAEGPANLEDFFDQIGFEDFEANSDFTTRPQRNTFGVGIANKEITVNGEKCTVIAVGLRGCGYYAEWAGDLNVGESGDHTGFAICRDKAFDFLQSYLENHPEITGRIKIWCTGYSRGAAGANMLGGRLDDMIAAGDSLNDNVTLIARDLYIYTFEAPMGADASTTEGLIYNNIHNIVNYNDLVVKVAPESMGFARYGVDHVLPSQSLDENYTELRDSMLEVFATFENAGEYRIDNFKYVTITPSATVEKLISSIRGDVMTQGEFLDIFVNKLFADVFSSRTEVYAAQDDIQELVLPLIGTYPDQWDSVKQSLAENARENLAELMSALLSGEERATETVANIVLDSMREAGITEYDASQVRAMVAPLVKILMKLAVKCPNELATLLYNVVGIMSAHYGELGMSWMLTLPGDYMTSKQEQPIYNPLPFIDVSEDAWYYDSLSYAYDEGLIKGTSYNVFSPDSEVTRGQVVATLYRMAGSPSVAGIDCPFNDLKGWYADAAVWAYSVGVAKGFSDEVFAGDTAVSREQLAAFLYRYAKVLDPELEAPSSYLGVFTDTGAVSGFAREAMRWAVGSGIIIGTDNKTLDPQGTATRAQLVTMLARFCQNLSL